MGLVPGVENQFSAYSPKVIDHFLNPRNMGDIDNADAIGEVGNPSCGDVMKISMKIENDKIVEAKFKTFGCAAAIATSSMATELLKGKTVEEAKLITDAAVIDALGGLPAIKHHCSVLAEDGIKAALKDYETRHSK